MSAALPRKTTCGAVVEILLPMHLGNGVEMPNFKEQIMPCGKAQEVMSAKKTGIAPQ